MCFFWGGGRIGLLIRINRIDSRFSKIDINEYFSTDRCAARTGRCTQVIVNCTVLPASLLTPSLWITQENIVRKMTNPKARKTKRANL